MGVVVEFVFDLGDSSFVWFEDFGLAVIVEVVVELCDSSSELKLRSLESFLLDELEVVPLCGAFRVPLLG